MMLKCIALFSVFVIMFVSGQNWHSNSYVLNHEKFFGDVMEETIMELERREWCNLKLDNIYQTISDSLYNFVVNGTVVYSNGFLISIQKIDVTEIQQSVTAPTVNGVVTTIATVRGRLSLRDAKVGFDVEATLENDGETSVHSFTGIYNYILIQYQIQVMKNLDTGEISSSAFVNTLSAGSGVRMIYMPANNITEALSRRWIPGNNFASVGRWATDVMVPIAANITINKIPFPDICIGCYL